nr:hypothetical protein [uncultured Desulfobulbus sp.]
MKTWDRIIILWGCLDILSLIGYGIKNIIDKKIPIVNDLYPVFDNLNSFGEATLIYIVPTIILILYLSLGVSGYFLIKRKYAGVILGYIQTPFRLLLILPPSISILIWLTNIVHLDPRNTIIISMAIIFTSELLKVFSLYKWQKLNINFLTSHSTGPANSAGQ